MSLWIDLRSPMTDAPSHTHFLPASQGGVVLQHEAAVLGQCALAVAALGTGCGRVPALPLPRAVFAPLLWRSAPQSLRAGGADAVAQQVGGGRGWGPGRVLAGLDPPVRQAPGTGLRTVEAVTEEDLPC